MRGNQNGDAKAKEKAKNSGKCEKYIRSGRETRAADQAETAKYARKSESMERRIHAMHNGAEIKILRGAEARTASVFAMKNINQGQANDSLKKWIKNTKTKQCD